MPDKLAIQGGPRTIDYTFKKYNSIGDLELTAATEVIQSGILSQFFKLKNKNRKINTFKKEL